MSLIVVSPVSGAVVGLRGVPDDAFATGVVGPGTAVDPDRAPGEAVAPVAGTLHKLKPYAFIVVTDDGRAVLVHLGVDTVQLDGSGFRLLANEGDAVAAGEPVVWWDPAVVEAGGRSPVCPVIALDAAAEVVAEAVEASRVSAGTALLRWG